MRASRPRKLAQLIVRLGLTISVVALAIAVTAPAVHASLSQAYATTTPIAIGSLVALDQKNVGNVTVADTTNSERLFGVVVSPSASSISLSSEQSTGQVQVATSGAVSALVTTSGGDIKVGDAIAVSPISGVGHKASGTVRIIGTAQSDFSASSTGVTKRTIETSAGKREVAIGQIPVLIAVATHSADGSVAESFVPNWVQSLSNTVAGKPVNPIRIIIAGLISLVCLVTVAVLLYAAVRNSIISIGRNPLSRTSILRSLLQVIAIAAAILAASVGAIYLVIAK